MGWYKNLWMVLITCVPTNVKRPKLRQSTTRIVKGGQYISCSGNSVMKIQFLPHVSEHSNKALPMSRNLTKVVKLGFFLAFMITEDWMICPAHSISTRGLSTVNQWILLRSRRPQNKTSNLRKNQDYLNFSLFKKRMYLTCIWPKLGEYPQGLVKLDPYLDPVVYSNTTKNVINDWRITTDHSVWKSPKNVSFFKNASEVKKWILLRK